MKRALIVVDYQNDFVDGALGFKKALKLESVIAEKISQARKEGTEVLFTLDTHEENYLQTQEGKNLPVAHCIRGTDGWKLFGKIAQMQEAEDKVFCKPCFGSWELGEYAKQQGYEQIELCGLVSNICVLSNAVLLKAALPEAVILVDAKATASFDESMNEKVLDILQGVQISVINK